MQGYRRGLPHLRTMGRKGQEKGGMDGKKEIGKDSGRGIWRDGGICVALQENLKRNVMKIWNSIFGSFKKKKKVEAPRGGGIDAALERAMREMRKERGEKEIEWEVRFTKTLQLGRLYSIVILFGFPGERDGFDPGLKGFVQANRNRAVTIEPLHPGVEPDPLADAEEVFRATVHYEAVQVAAGILAVPQVAAEVDEAEGLVRFRWEADEGEGEDRHRNDLVYGVVACPAFGDCRIRELGKRGESGECVIPARPQWKGLELWAYVFSTTEDGMDASGSACVAERVVINNVALTAKG